MEERKLDDNYAKEIIRYAKDMFKSVDINFFKRNKIVNDENWTVCARK